MINNVGYNCVMYTSRCADVQVNHCGLQSSLLSFYGYPYIESACQQILVRVLFNHRIEHSNTTI